MSIVTRTADWLMAHTPPATVMRRRVDLVTLAYHGVDDRSQFAIHLDHLAAAFAVVSLADVLAAVDGGTLPPRAALITFDDGERSVFTDGLPELEKRGMPAVLFAVPGVTDTSTPFWWTEAEQLLAEGAHSELLPTRVSDAGTAAVIAYLKTISDVRMQEILTSLRQGRDPVVTPQLRSEELIELDRRGVQVENHSMTHPLLDMCTGERIEAEISDAHDRLREILGREPTVFAYPNGNVDDRVTAMLVRRAYHAAFLFDHRLTRIPVRDALLMSRVRVNSTTSTDRFMAIVAGVHPAIHHARGRS